MLSTIGYEGASLRDFVETLRAARVQAIIDVRERAQSRRPGFSKVALAAELAANKITYVHFPELGDPKIGREAARSGQTLLFQSIYHMVLKSPEANNALARIIETAETKSVCLLCYEKDPLTCHRKLIAEAIESASGLKTRHLGVQELEPARERTRSVRRSNQSVAA